MVALSTVLGFTVIDHWLLVGPRQLSGNRRRPPAGPTQAASSRAPAEGGQERRAVRDARLRARGERDVNPPLGA